MLVMVDRLPTTVLCLRSRYCIFERLVALYLSEHDECRARGEQVPVA